MDAASTDILAVANSPILWICALAVLGVIVVQSVIYLTAVRRAAPDAGLTAADTTRAFRTGAVAAIGPSLAVALIAISLVALFGTPATLVRIGLIGSAPFETLSASIATQTQGVVLGGEGYTQGVFAIALLAMSLGGAGWMIVTLIVTPLLKRGVMRSGRSGKRKTAAMGLIPAAAMAGAFLSTFAVEAARGWINFAVIATSALVMGVCLFLAKRLGAGWLKEWALGFSILFSIFVAYALSGLGA